MAPARDRGSLGVRLESPDAPSEVVHAVKERSVPAPNVQQGTSRGPGDVVGEPLVLLAHPREEPQGLIREPANPRLPSNLVSELGKYRTLPATEDAFVLDPRLNRRSPMREVPTIEIRHLLREGARVQPGEPASATSPQRPRPMDGPVPVPQVPIDRCTLPTAQGATRDVLRTDA